MEHPEIITNMTTAILFFLFKKNLDFCATMCHICSQWHGLHLSPIPHPQNADHQKNTSKFAGGVLIKQLHAVALSERYSDKRSIPPVAGKPPKHGRANSIPLLSVARSLT